MYVCIYLCMYACVYVNDVYVCVLCMYLCVCKYLCAYVFVYVCMQVWTCIYLCVCMSTYVWMNVCVICMSAFICMCMYVCTYVRTQSTHKSTSAPLGRQTVTHCYCTLTPIYIPAFSLFCCPYRLYSHVTALITVLMKWRKSNRKYDEMSDANLVFAHRFVLGSIPSKPWKQKINVPNNVVEYTEVFMIYF